MSDATTIAHISDLHLGPLPAFSAGHWNVKRGLGYLNWRRKRRHIHQSDIADKLVADLIARAPDHIAVTGDLVNIALPEEYERAAHWLGRLGAPQRVSVVPGNHDIYVRLRPGDGIAHWANHMSACGWGEGLRSAGHAFPFVRRVGQVALIGLNSARPTPPFVAAGRLGERQREALERILDASRAAGLARVVLIHHPPLPGQIHARAALADAGALERSLTDHGADLVLHGHTHLDTIERRAGPHGDVTVVGVASGSAGRRHRGAPLARYNLFRIWREASRTRIAMTARGLRDPGGPVVELDSRTLI